MGRDERLLIMPCRQFGELLYQVAAELRVERCLDVVDAEDLGGPLAHEQGEVEEDVEDALVDVLGREDIVPPAHEFIKKVKSRLALAQFVSLIFELIRRVHDDIVYPGDAFRSLKDVSPDFRLQRGDSEIEGFAIYAK